MADDKFKDPFMAISTIVVVLAALGVTFFAKGPLKILRPVSALREPAEQVRARLWQDPFAAVIEMDQPQQQVPDAKAEFFPIDGPVLKSPESERSAPLRKNISSWTNNQQVLVLAVMVDGGPYANDTESRIRHRVAVLSALQFSGYDPEDSEHINFFRIKIAGEPPAAPLHLGNFMPYEWLEKKTDPQEWHIAAKHRPQKILLLWLNDSIFYPQPLEKLNNLIRFLQSADDNLKLPYIVIGPAGSNKLDIMIKELNHIKTKFNNLAIYSPMATLPNYLFLSAAQKRANLSETEKQAETEIHRLFKEKANIDFYRTIPTDLKLADRLLAELENRQIKSSRDHIVLISEWDTKYGRDLPRIFYDIIKENTGAEVNRVHFLSYLRGIDGIVPGVKTGSGQESAAKDKGSDQTGRNQADKLMHEEPIGRNQLDYLRRLADSLHDMDGEMQNEEKGRIRAVGILGTDFYDKYLVLQAFKQRFPAAVFFTTDLDARFLHEAYNDSTRNLIVASGFDLQIPACGESSMAPVRIAPFRNSYQTAIFCAIIKAFHHLPPTSTGAPEDGEEPKPAGGEFSVTRPYLFEIGHQRAVNLDTEKTGLLPRHPEVLFKKQLLALVFITLAVTFVWIISLGFRKWLAHHYLFSIILLLMVTACGFLFYRTILLGAAEESVTFFSGISIWPTILIRLIALAFTWIFIVNANESLRRSDTNLAADYSLVIPPSQPWHLFISKGNRFLPPSIQVDNGKISINILWKVYQEYNSGIFQILRVLFTTLLYCALPVLLFWLFGPPLAPVRGVWSTKWYSAIMLTTTLSFLFLTFFVFDNTRLLRWFINEALDNEPTWQPESREKFVEKNSISGSEVDYWMLIQLVARRTETVNRLIFYPFIIWLMFFISRWTYFDNWTTPPVLALVIAMSAFFTWSCAIFLNRAAEKLRLQLIARLKTDLITLQSYPTPDAARQNLVKSILGEIESISRGAFTPFFKNPVVQALFVPFGGVGGLTLLDFLSKLS